MGGKKPAKQTLPSLQGDTTNRMIPNTFALSSSPPRNAKRRRLNPPEPRSPRTRSEKRIQQAQDPKLPGVLRQHTRAQSLYSQSTEPSEVEQKSNLESAALKVTNYTPQNRGDHENLLQRSLQAFLDHLPDAGRSGIAKDIIDLQDDDAIYQYFRSLYTGLRTRMRSRSKPPSVASIPTEQRDSHAERISTSLDQPVSRTMEFREGLLQRDGYRCVLTGDMEFSHWESLDCPEDVIDLGKTEGAHIIPFSYAAWDPRRNNLLPDVSRAWEVLWRCFPSMRAIGFNHEDINSLCNGLTLTNWVHEHFGAFRIAFECTGAENKYKVHTFKGVSDKYKAHFPLEVRFINKDTDNDRSLPSPILLDCHFRLAKILNASGMAAAFDFDFEEWEEVKVRAGGQLPEDGDIDISQALCVGLELCGYAIRGI
ncbi:hypothetical protein N7457_006525 [Penicillium paradoxum]|uniref:uncharacterized protein n=1 Tax=Penicillium paradoxum TaxID=176176 RepID=UPI0025473BBB|nr:uncharacterized protein N7457_006525 [Penicillium paradoxum]KAJ5781365.1 hypothetical protein N7457_006525 [Penicillium paradoxum]